MGCKLIYQGQEFDTQEAVVAYIQGQIVPMLQSNMQEEPKASAATLAKTKEFLKRIGVDIQAVRKIVDANGVIVDANAQADLLHQLIQIVDGKEDVALTEEAMHFAIEIIEQTNPALFKQLFDGIGSYQVFNDVLNDPIYRAQYSINGKPDIRLMKKEAIGKVLAQTFIRQQDGNVDAPEQVKKAMSWFASVKEFFKKLFNKAGFNPFEEATKIIENPTEGVSYDKLVREILSKGGTGIFADIFRDSVESGDTEGAISMYAQQLSDPATFQTTVDNFLGGDTELGNRILQASKPLLQAAPKKDNAIVDGIYNSIKQTHNKITLQTNTLTGDSFYEIDGKKIPKRVTDLTNTFYDTAFRASRMTKGEAQTAINDYKKDKGTDGHSDMEALFHRYIDDDGYIRETAEQLPTSKLDPNNTAYINKLDEYMKDMFDSYPKGTRFLAEHRIYNGRDEAGTVDFMAILPNGDVDIRDWKFMDQKQTASDVPWYKKEAFNIQIGEYKKILNRQYNVKKFRQTRAIPILVQYKWADFQKKDALKLTGMSIGSFNAKNIEDLRLLPVATKDESTGNKKVDNLLQQLNALYSNIQREKVVEGRKDLKREKLNQLERAIRTLHIKGEVKELLRSAAAIIASTQKEVGAYENRINDVANPLSREERRDLALKITESQDIIQFYKELKSTFKSFPLEESEQTELNSINTKANDVIESINDIKGPLADIIATGFRIKGLLNPETTVKALSKLFVSLSQARTKGTQVLWRIQEEIRGNVDVEFDREMDKLNKIKDGIESLAKAKGVEAIDLSHKIIHFENGRRTNRLISKIDKKFYSDLKEAQVNGQKDWLKDNIDIDAYKEWYKERIVEKTVYEKNQTYSFNSVEENEQEQDSRIAKFKKQYDPINLDSSNDQLYRFPLEAKWTSKEFADINKPENKALLDLYNYWQTQLKESHELGMLEDKAYSRFLPNVKKSFLEKLTDGNIGIGANKTLKLLKGISATDNDDITKDPFTGRPIDTITPAYLHNLGEEKFDKDRGEKYLDYTNTSDDLIRIMALWTEQKLLFKYRTQAEAEIKLLGDVERNKKSISINRRTKEVATNKDNEENAEYFDNFANNMLYNRKYGEKYDGVIKWNVNKSIDKINDVIEKVSGSRPIPRNERDEIHVSTTRFIESINRYMQAKVLGLNISAPLSNMVGGSMNAYIKADKFFDKKELAANQLLFASSKFNTKEGAKAAGLVEYFLPLTEDEKREKTKALSVKGTVSNMGSDWLWYLQRKSDRFVQIPVFWSFLQNTIVENGELVNIRELVRKNNNAANMYQLPIAERQALEIKMEQEISELKKRSVFNIAEIKDDKIQIAGIEHGSPTAQALSNRVKQFSKDILGNMDPNDISQYRMNILLNSIMMFKNWIPRMLKTRFGSLSYSVGKDEWEWGRIQMVRNALFHNLWDGAKYFLDIQSGRESLIDRAKIAYQEKREDFGDDFMTEQEFVDMYANAARQTIREMLMTLSLLGMYFGAVGLAKNLPPDEDQKVKGAAKYFARMSDRFYGELSFFYSPSTAMSIAGGSILPAASTVLELQRFATNGLKDGYYTIIGDTKGAENTKTSKHLFKAIPITRQMVEWIALFNDDIAKEYGVQVPLQARQTR